MGNAARDITVSLKRKKKGSRLCIMLRGFSEPIESKPLPDAYLVECKYQFSELLAGLSKQWGINTLAAPGWEALSRSIHLLHGFSLNLLDDVFEEKDYGLLCDWLASATRSRCDKLMAGSPLGVIEYEASLDEFIPLDYLFFGRPEHLDPQNLNELMVSLAHIVGFSYIVRRNPPRSEKDDRDERVNDKQEKLVSFDDKLDVNIYAYKGFAGHDREVGFFQGPNASYFDATDLEYPEEYAGDASQALVSRLLEKTRPHFHHFSCHCFTEDPHPWQHKLVFGRKEILLQDVRTQYLSSSSPERPGFPETTAFLNACGSAAINPLMKASLPTLFLRCLKHSGFIGPEYKVPDAFASEFARIFYANLLTCGDLGLALFRTKWFFARIYHNPFGLLYTLYADCDMRLSRTVPSVHV